MDMISIGLCAVWIISTNYWNNFLFVEIIKCILPDIVSGIVKQSHENKSILIQNFRVKIIWINWIEHYNVENMTWKWKHRERTLKTSQILYTTVFDCLDHWVSMWVSIDTHQK